MEKKELKKLLVKEVSANIMGAGKISAEFIRSIAERVFTAIGQDKKYASTVFDDSLKNQLIDSLCDDFLGLGPIQKLIDDPEVSEIMINGPHDIFIEKGAKKSRADIQFDDEAQLRHIIEKMIIASGRRRLDESSPYVDFSLKDGSRINAVIPPIAADSSSVTIRKFLASLETIEDLIKLDTLDRRMADFLVACIKTRISILFSGATGSGKTSTLRIFASYFEAQERVITIEDALEIDLKQQNMVRLLTRQSGIEGKGEITLRDLFRNTLRMRPNRIILGEIRGPEAMDYVQALNSGQKGCLSVIHASSPADAVTRLETMALYAGVNMPVWAIQQQLASGLDLIVQQEQLPDGRRKITQISQIIAFSKEQGIALEDIFRYDIEQVDADGNVQGRWVATGCVPVFLERFKKYGVSLSQDIFKKG